MSTTTAEATGTTDAGWHGCCLCGAAAGPGDGYPMVAALVTDTARLVPADPAAPPDWPVRVKRLGARVQLCTSCYRERPDRHGRKGV